VARARGREGAAVLAAAPAAGDQRFWMADDRGAGGGVMPIDT
jgi:hypothetical protein